MPVIKLSIESALAPAGVMDVLTDFGPTRPQQWPTIDHEHFTVHAQGDNWAEVTEGTAAAWERARYEWDTRTSRVTVTTHDSKVFGPGGGWVFQLTPTTHGTRVDIELTRNPKGLRRRTIAALLQVVGPSSFRRSFSKPLRAK